MSSTRDQRRNLYEKMVGSAIAGNRFVITNLLGFGGMGAVYEATQTAMNRSVALKLIPTHDETTVRRFEREALTISQLHHPNTVTVFDYGQAENGFLFLAMELLDGKTLSDVIKETGPLSPKRAVHIATQICKSLNEAHRAGIVHRDIKPDNIILIRVDSDSDFVKVLDFGIAKAVMGEDDVNLTGDGRIIGTPRYMSPEQILGEPVDHRSDVYSLGCILFEMLCGAPPFQQSTTTALMLAHAQETPPSFSQRLAAASLERIPHYLENVVRKALEKTAIGRQQSVEELRRELEEAMASAPNASVSQSSISHSSVSQSGISHSSVSSQSLSSLSSQSDMFQRAPSTQSAPIPVQPFLTSTGTHSPPKPAAPVDEQLSGNKKALIAISLILLVMAGLLIMGLNREESGSIEVEPVVVGTESQPVKQDTNGYVSVKIRSTPSGARIFRDGKDFHRTTPTTLAFKEGEKVDFRFELEGFKPYQAQVVVDADTQVEVNLERLAASKPAEVVEKKVPVQRPVVRTKRPEPETVRKEPEVEEVEPEKKPETKPGVDLLLEEPSKPSVDILD